MSTSAPLAPALSRTCQDLHAARLHTRHARSLYLACARDMADLPVLAHALRFTAAQEKEQADIFQGLLSTMTDEVPGETETPLLPRPRDPETLLTLFSREERNAAETFRACAGHADGEGRPRIASAFRRIAETEDRHALRFEQYLGALREGTLFCEKTPVSWVCLACGELHAGTEPPEGCAGCGGAGSGYLRSDGFPFAVR